MAVIVHTVSTAADGVFMLPRGTAALLPRIDGGTLKVLIYICEKQSYSVDEGAKFLAMTNQEFESALSYLKGAGLINSTAQQKQTPQKTGVIQTYDSEIIAEALETNAEFNAVAEIAGQKLGKLLNKNDLNSLFYLFDFVALDAQYICGIIEYCVSKDKKSMQYIMKTALSMADEGIDTYELLEAHLARKAQREQTVKKLKTLCGFGDRTLSPNEEALMTKWFEEMAFSFDMVKLAYEKTVDSIGKANLKYMNTILDSWYSSGFKKPEDTAAASDGKKKKDSFDTDEFFAAAVKHSQSV